MIVSERRGTDLLLLTLQRPEKRNALSQALIEQLTSELRHSDADPAVRGVILAGTGPNFCAGADLHQFPQATPATPPPLIKTLKGLIAALMQLSQPCAFALRRP